MTYIMYSVYKVGYRGAAAPKKKYIYLGQVKNTDQRNLRSSMMLSNRITI